MPNEELLCEEDLFDRESTAIPFCLLLKLLWLFLERGHENWLADLLNRIELLGFMPSLSLSSRLLGSRLD